MKIKKLLLSVCMICLALLVLAGATVPAMQFRAQAMAVRATSDNNIYLQPKELFNGKGNYTVDLEYLKNAIQNGQVFNFFGHDWRIVFVNETESVATFWMADPYTPNAYKDQDEFDGVIFNKTTQSAIGILKDGSNIWTNGYSGSVWTSNEGDVVIAQSQIRTLLNNEASAMIDNKAYAKYKNKVVAGYVNGTNEQAIEKAIAQLAYSEDNLNQVEGVLGTSNLVAKYGLDQNDRLWLPSVNELTAKWNVSREVIKWINTTNNQGRAWLRSPDVSESQFAVCVCAEEVGTTGKIDDLFVAKKIKQKAGVRPAIHLNISELTETATNNGGWFNEDWLKVLFIVVCVLGIVGVGLVITAVVIKSRQKKAK